MIQIYVGWKKIIISLAISHTFPFSDILECFPFHWCVNWITGQSWLHGGRWDWISGVESGAAWQRMDYSSSRATHQAFTLLSKDEADWIEPIGFFFFKFQKKGESSKTSLYVVQCLFYKHYRTGRTLGPACKIFIDFSLQYDWHGWAVKFACLSTAATGSPKPEQQSSSQHLQN